MNGFMASESHKWYNTTNNKTALAVLSTPQSTTHRLEVDMYPQYTASDVARFWSKVDKSGVCWLWTASKRRRGYGRFTVKRVISLAAHRVAYELTYGSIPEGLVICHKCDNPSCVNPTHLFAGTQQDNRDDCKQKGRTFYPGAKNPARGERNGKYTRPEQTPRGERVGTSKLTWGQVREIRARHATGTVSNNALAREYNVSSVAIGLIVRGLSWKE